MSHTSYESYIDNLKTDCNKLKGSGYQLFSDVNENEYPAVKTPDGRWIERPDIEYIDATHRLAVVVDIAQEDQDIMRLQSESYDILRALVISKEDTEDKEHDRCVMCGEPINNVLYSDKHKPDCPVVALVNVANILNKRIARTHERINKDNDKERKENEWYEY